MNVRALFVILILVAGCGHGQASSGLSSPTTPDHDRIPLPVAPIEEATFTSAPVASELMRCRREADLDACRALAAEGDRPYEEHLVAHTVLCDAGSARACLALSGLLLSGHGAATPGAPGAARKIDARVCAPQAKLATPDAVCLRHVHMLRQGTGGKRDAARAGIVSAWLCEAGVWRACTIQAALIEDGEVEVPAGGSQQEAARALYERAASQGDGEAMASLGEHALWGVGVAQDREVAREHFERACQADSTRGCARLGMSYHFGLGVERDFELAATHYTLACERGDVGSCVALGHLVETGMVGEGVAQAVELYARNCESGGMAACLNLGFMYEHGRGVERDEARAHALYVQACKGGEEGGCHRLNQSD